MIEVTEEDRAYLDGMFNQIQDMHEEAQKNIKVTSWFLVISLVVLICSAGLFLFSIEHLKI